MTAATTGQEAYAEALHLFEKELAGSSNARGAAALRPLREKSLARFADLGFPTTKQESWKYTNVAPIAKHPFRVVARASPNGLNRGSLGALTPGAPPGAVFVVVDGVAVPALGTAGSLPDGVTVASLASALATHRDLVEPHLARLAGAGGKAFPALNEAFLHDGAFVHVPRHVVVKEPVHILFYAAMGGGATASCPRTLVVTEEGSQLSFVETFAGVPSAAYFTNAVTEIYVAEGAVVEHSRIQREGPLAYHVGTTAASLGRGASYTSHSFALGGLLARTDIEVSLDGEGCDVTLNGLYVTGGRQHVDNHTLIDHAKPRGTSRELYKGVLDGQSRGVFDGKIIVRKDAQKTDARQVNNNLLISDEALVDTKPQLEINADDVKCAHAATIGQIDSNALFYLRSRALGIEEARRLLMRAFVGDLLSRLRIESLRTDLAALLDAKLDGRDDGRGERP